MSGFQRPCPACGQPVKLDTNLQLGSLFACPHCGAKLRVPARKPGPPAAEPPDTPAHRPEPMPKPKVQKAASEVKPAASRKKRAAHQSRHLWIACGLSAALLIAVGALVWDQIPWDRATTAAGSSADAEKKPSSTASSQVAQNPPATPKAALPSAERKPVSRPRGFDDWLQDFEAAKQKAASEQKDVMVLFDGSDWCGWSMRLAQEVFFQPWFRERAEKQFVLVFVDFPQQPWAKGKVQDAQRNEALAQRFDIMGFPTVILTDGQGRPYGREGYLEGGAGVFLERLVQCQGQRRQLEELAKTVGEGEAGAKLAKAREVVEVLYHHNFLSFYGPELEALERLAGTHDGRNEKGDYEWFFEMNWLNRAAKAGDEETAELTGLIARLDDWKKTHQFKDPDRAIRLHLNAGRMLAKAGKVEKALAYVQSARTFKPATPQYQACLDHPLYALGIGTGTGFVVGADGYLLTNHHVAGGPGRVLVRLPNKKLVAAEIVAADEANDIALLRLPSAAGVRFTPLPVAGQSAPQRGDPVATFGYPLGDTLGSGLKLTRGVIGGVSEEENKPGLLLDIRVNPGNSGGPLCDTCGNVVGIVTAKSFARERELVESYGLALAAPRLEAFLQKHLPGYQAAPAKTQKLEWNEVDRLVHPSVFMILKAPATAKELAQAEEEKKAPNPASPKKRP